MIHLISGNEMSYSTCKIQKCLKTQNRIYIVENWIILDCFSYKVLIENIGMFKPWFIFQTKVHKTKALEPRFTIPFRKSCPLQLLLCGSNEISQTKRFV